MSGYDLAMIREAHAAQSYEFKTDLTYCPSSDVPTDQCHTCIVLALLDRVEAAEAAVERVRALHAHPAVILNPGELAVAYEYTRAALDGPR